MNELAPLQFIACLIIGQTVLLLLQLNFITSNLQKILEKLEADS